MSETRNNSRSRRKWIKRAIVTVIILLIAGALIFAWTSYRRNAEHNTLLKDTARVTMGNISVITQAGGTINYADTVTLESPSDGTVGDFDLRVGDAVQEGDVLLTINNELYEEEIAALEKELETLDMSLLTESSMKTSAVRSPVAGRVKGIFVQKGDDLSAVCQTLEGVVLISPDDLMSVMLPAHAAAALNDPVNVSIGDLTVNGTVTSVDTENVGITFVDQSFEVGKTAKVVDSEGLEIGTGAIFVKTPYYVIATDGIVSSIPVSLNKTVSFGATLINLEKAVHSTAYLRLLESRQEALEKLSGKRLDSATAELTAPADGIITEILTQPDAKILKDAPAIVMSDSNQFELTVNVDEMEIAGITVGKTCEVHIYALEGRTFTGTVTWVSRFSSNFEGVSRYPVTVELNDQTEILSGMSARADILVTENTGVLLVPAQAVQVIDGKKFVSVVDSVDANDQTDEEGRSVEVQTGISSGSMTEIISGLNEGDIVILPTEASSGFDRFMF